MKKRKYKSETAQRVYDLYRSEPPTTRHCAAASAYFNGYNGINQCFGAKGSVCAAALAAGIDNREDSEGTGV